MKSLQSPKTRSGLGQWDSDVLPATRLAKTHEDYWKSRLRRRTYRRADGTEAEVPEWQVKLFRDGRQSWINLETPNRDAAARKARDLWLKLKTTGWDAVKPKREKLINPTIGEYLATVRAEADLLPVTYEIYAAKFRCLVAGAIGLEGGREKHDHIHGGQQQWRARIEAVRLGRLTPTLIQRWKTQYLEKAANNPLKERRARRTVASILRSSKALFAGRITSKLHIQLPDPLPLATVDIPKAPPSQYMSRIDPSLLFTQAQHELESPTDQFLEEMLITTSSIAQKSRGTKCRYQRKPETIVEQLKCAISRERVQRAEAFKIFCLALFAGLRRDEIDTLTWQQIDFTNHIIRIETNEYTRAKTEGSETGIDIDPALTGRMREWMKASDSPFVIASPVKPRPQVASYHHYRTHRLVRKLLAWLKSHGVDDRMALHTLRKEFGTQINRTHGLFAASAALRHTSIQLTRAVYVAKKERAVFTLPTPQPATAAAIPSLDNSPASAPVACGY